MNPRRRRFSRGCTRHCGSSWRRGSSCSFFELLLLVAGRNNSVDATTLNAGRLQRVVGSNAAHGLRRASPAAAVDNVDELAALVLLQRSTATIQRNAGAGVALDLLARRRVDVAAARRRGGQRAPRLVDDRIDHIAERVGG